MKNKFLHFTKSERWGLIIWSITILVISFSGTYLTNSHLDRHNQAVLEQYFRKLDSISVIRDAANQTVAKLQPFNPDTVDAEDLRKMGLPEDLSERWVNFREYIGSYEDPEDVAKIYGMDSSMYALLLPYIEFAPKHTPPSPYSDEEQPFFIETKAKEVTGTVDPKPISSNIKLDINRCTSNELEQLGFSSYVAKRIVKYRNSAGEFYDRDELLRIYGIDTQQYLHVKENLTVDIASLTKIDLNYASEETLKTLPGIGPAYAKRIIKFRKVLGGFLHISQLKEVYGVDQALYEKLKLRLKITKGAIKKIKINEVIKDSLVKHPYINWDQAQKIMNYRKHHYPIQSLKDMVSLDPEWIEKVEPYIDYSDGLGNPSVNLTGNVQ